MIIWLVSFHPFPYRDFPCKGKKFMVSPAANFKRSPLGKGN